MKKRLLILSLGLLALQGTVFGMDWKEQDWSTTRREPSVDFREYPRYESKEEFFSAAYLQDQHAIGVIRDLFGNEDLYEAFFGSGSYCTQIGAELQKILPAGLRRAVGIASQARQVAAIPGSNVRTQQGPVEKWPLVEQLCGQVSQILHREETSTPELEQFEDDNGIERGHLVAAVKMSCHSIVSYARASRGRNRKFMGLKRKYGLKFLRSGAQQYSIEIPAIKKIVHRSWMRYQSKDNGGRVDEGHIYLTGLHYRWFEHFKQELELTHVFMLKPELCVVRDDEEPTIDNCVWVTDSLEAAGFSNFIPINSPEAGAELRAIFKRAVLEGGDSLSFISDITLIDFSLAMWYFAQGYEVGLATHNESGKRVLLIKFSYAPGIGGSRFKQEISLDVSGRPDAKRRFVAKHWDVPANVTKLWEDGRNGLRQFVNEVLFPQTRGNVNDELIRFLYIYSEVRPAIGQFYEKLFEWYSRHSTDLAQHYGM